MPTSAKFQIWNGWRKALFVNATPTELGGEFPTPLTVASSNLGPSEPVHMSAAAGLSQSWLALQMGKCEVGINLGRGLFDAGIRYKTGETDQVEVVMAPVEPLVISGYDFFIWVLACPGKVQKMITDAIEANLKPLSLIVQRQDIHTEIGGFKIGIKNVEFENFVCSHASVTKPGPKSSWNIDLVLSFTGRLVINLNGVRYDIKFEELQVYMSAQLSTKNAEKALDINVTRAQVAVKKMEGLGLNDLIIYQFPGLANSTLNPLILAKLNSYLHTEAMMKTFKGLGIHNLEQYNIPEHDKTPASKGQYQQWMSKSNIQDKTLAQIQIPATHDSHAYKFERKLSSVIYDDQRFLTRCSPEKAPDGYYYHEEKTKEDEQKEKDTGKKKDSTLTYYLGRSLYDFLLDQVSLLAQCHHETRNIQKQLEDGIRRFDLRICYEKNLNGYYTAHTVLGPKLDDIFQQIRNFVDANRNSQELMIFEMSRGWFSVESGHVQIIAKMVQEKFGSYIYLPPDYSPSQKYDFQKLKDIKLSSITQGGPKVLFVNTDGPTYPHSVLNVADGTYYPGPPQGATPGSGLYSQYFTITPEVEECAGGIMMNLYDMSIKYPFLKLASWRNNASVKEVLKSNPVANSLVMDWTTECKGVGADGKGPIDWIVEWNNRRVVVL